MKWIKETPNEDEVILCYGNKTVCCEEDMEEQDWHKVIYSNSGYWYIDFDEDFEFMRARVINVTHIMRIDKP